MLEINHTCEPIWTPIRCKFPEILIRLVNYQKLRFAPGHITQPLLRLFTSHEVSGYLLMCKLRQKTVTFAQIVFKDHRTQNCNLDCAKFQVIFSESDSGTSQFTILIFLDVFCRNYGCISTNLWCGIDRTRLHSEVV